MSTPGKILVTGAGGQVGSDLTTALRQRYGDGNVVASDKNDLEHVGLWRRLDTSDKDELNEVVVDYGVGTIFHLAAVLSAVAEKEPVRAWRVNMDGLLNVLETARAHRCRVFFPSSIGTFGPLSPRMNTPQDTIQRPNTMYGITKLTGELLCDYYHRHHGVDTRGIRYPGIISWSHTPGGGTTDYAVEIFKAALTRGHYECYLKPETALPMIYMPDAVRAAIELMEAPETRLMHRNGFNVTAMSFTPRELALEIRNFIPTFRMTYKIDPARQAIADSWPQSLDDSAARHEWGWNHVFDLEPMVADMLNKLSAKGRV
ncbi:MAG: NAD-dependent epimerase/dehydratase family protein [Parcubacteria group bacterium]|nr:NAD-dependent epimerase/dehydratase family protein [Parcubacteria group bacterium]